tara:strand:- start:168 stop:548 length:381 start_codon:yes stop_codon:yes gene_type:complete
MINDILFTEELDNESIKNLKVKEDEDEESFNNIQDIERLYLKKKARPHSLNLNNIYDENIPLPLKAPKKIKKVGYTLFLNLDNLNFEDLNQQNFNFIEPMAPRHINYIENNFNSNVSPDSVRLLHK